MNKDIFPQITGTYKCYDDGKVKKSHEYYVTIKNIIELDKPDSSWKSEKIRLLLKENIENHDWLFGHMEHKYLLEVVSTESDILKDISLYMAKTLNGDWFGLGYWYLNEDNYVEISEQFNCGLLWFNKTFEIE